MKHLTEDPELLERFIMKRVAPREREEIHTHLKTCAPCREAVAHERAVADGVRWFARDQMKKRLVQRLLARETRVPWPHILSAAAVVLMVVGLGYHQAWWSSPPRTVTDSEIRIEPPRPEEKSPAAGGVRPDSRRRVDEPAGGMGSRDARPQPRLAEPRDAEALEDESPAPLHAKADDESVAEFAPTRVSQESGQLWLQGQVLRRKHIRTKSDLGSRKERPMAMEKASGGETDHRKREETQLVSISQQPLSRIPANQRMKQTGAGILTSVEMDNDILALTLYSDTLDLKERNIRVEPLTGDSIVITINGSLVGYKIPGGWGKGKKALKLLE